MQAMRSIRNIIFLQSTLFILCLLSACHTNDSNSLIDGLEIPSNALSKPDSLSRTELISIFDSEMSQCSGISWTEAFTGKETRQSFRYHWFSTWATTDELLNLVNSKNTNTKVLAFLALKNRKDVDVKSIVQNHLQDTASFVETYGCFGNSKRVNSYFLEESIGWFSKAEIIRFRNLVSKLNSKLDS
jgi:hypothetical protein